MKGVLSLRARLTAIILAPLMLVAVLVGLWQLNNARQTAADVFDKRLLAAALAVANDVAFSSGDALSARTRDILADTSGAPVFYHVYAPDGVIVAGYATPPVGIPKPVDQVSGPAYFTAAYLGRTVHGVRLQNSTQIDGFAGVFTTTVWQDAAVRAEFVRDLLVRALLAISGLIAALGLIVWFGVRIGLRPLTNLQAAIASRSSDELTPIQRAVPVEVEGVVATLNRLFAQVTRSMTAQSEFISNAAHQLRNPIAGVLSLAEAVEAAPSFEQSQERARDLLDAARETANLSQKLLLLERAKTISPSSEMVRFDMDRAFDQWAAELARDKGAPPHVLFEAQGVLGSLTGDETMLHEAVRNLVDNALRHGGPDLGQVTVSARRTPEALHLAVTDDGAGLPQGAQFATPERFRTYAPTSRSGLGVSIVEAVVQGHGGTLRLVPQDRGQNRGLRVALQIPLRQS